MTALIVSARVTLTQRYSNTNLSNTAVAQYIFPVPSYGAVCAFKMETTDGRVVSAVVKEKDIAKKTFDSAVAQGKWAGLLYEATPDSAYLATKR